MQFVLKKLKVKFICWRLTFEQRCEKNIYNIKTRKKPVYLNIIKKRRICRVPYAEYFIYHVCQMYLKNAFNIVVDNHGFPYIPTAMLIRT